MNFLFKPASSMTLEASIGILMSGSESWCWWTTILHFSIFIQGVIFFLGAISLRGFEV